MKSSYYSESEAKRHSKELMKSGNSKPYKKLLAEIELAQSAVSLSPDRFHTLSTDDCQGHIVLLQAKSVQIPPVISIKHAGLALGGHVQAHAFEDVCNLIRVWRAAGDPPKYSALKPRMSSLLSL